VTGTAGVERHRLRFTGRGGHAGTVPMERRRDPLAAATAHVAAGVRALARVADQALSAG
jgi:acetylornithine deacetylase/succinyl-diaminopimelate desuccinylase-like protein